MYIDSKFRPHVETFVKEAKLRGIEVDTKQLTMFFGDTKTKEDSTTIGTCQFDKGRPIIFIDDKWYDASPEIEQEELVFHELGHCLLMRDHCEVKDKDGSRVSIMEPEIISGDDYSARRKAMLDELFKPHPDCP